MITNASIAKINDLAISILEEKLHEEVDVGEVIKELIDTSWGGSNESQAKAIELLKGLAFSDDPASNKFMKALDEFTSGLNAEDFMSSGGE